jgi:hypothetical protein
MRGFVDEAALASAREGIIVRCLFDAEGLLGLRLFSAR